LSKLEPQISKSRWQRLHGRPQPLWFRLLGLLPLAFFLLHAGYYLCYGGLSHMLWMCNIGNLVLAAGMLGNFPALVRIAVAWLLPGLALWIVTYVLPGAVLLTSAIAHVGGLLVGLVALWRVGASRWAWLEATGYYLLMQQLSRLFTPAALNINVAHAVWPGWEKYFSTYVSFWLATTIVAAGGQWTLWLILRRLLPTRRAARATLRPA
jgi:hypothetical protein